MTIRFGKFIMLFGMLLVTLRVSALPIWPVRPNEAPANFNIIHCTFGEIHGGGNSFHQGIDIGVPNGTHPKSIENGVVRYKQGQTIEIGYGTPTNNVYPRKIVIHEFTPNPNLQVGSLVAAGVTELGTIDQGHLHFEMWYLDGNTYYPVNPLNNDVGWELPYHQYVTDVADPEVNNIFFELITEPANVASGYLIPQPRSGAIIDAANNTAAKIHITDRPGSNAPDYDPDVDKLVVFGSVGPIVNTRDVNVNSLVGGSGNGLTVQTLRYAVDTWDKYLITFDRLAETDKYQVNRLFHTEFNAGGDELYGNNDFIEVRNENTYLYPHKLINGIQSNGVWFTKARNTTPHVFDQTPTDIAAVSEEALYPDGKHTLTFHVEDAAGRIDRADGKAEDNAQVVTIVDNYRPYVKKLNMTSGEFPIYSSTWRWTRNGNQGTLALSPDASGTQADRGKPLSITVTTSEPMKMVTDATGKPTGSMNIKLFARDPQHPNRIAVEKA